MLTETGRVVALEDGTVWVETLRSSHCHSCAARAGCGHGLVNTAQEGISRGLIKAGLAPGRSLDLALHDQVQISLPEVGFLRAVSLLYLLPLLLLILGALVGDAVAARSNLQGGGVDAVVTLGAVLGLGLGLFLARVSSRWQSANPIYQPVVTGKL